ncbi:hypothetical protein [Alloacidobacterium sp.]|uniref:hypothetical protein n=1 Tax=Alloacidobacterium sp. TaxID=2951999 RepID=UPI002D43CFEB|nr:hypothetical protein [Alloacidobacterium sp.]HYK35375.1 hypothetical protein [Alloacidobacterium sp.]
MKACHFKFSITNVLLLTLATMFSYAAANAQNSGLQADLRSSAAVPNQGGVLPTAPAGGVVVGQQSWVCDAAEGFAPVVNAQTGALDPFLAIGTSGNIKLPISPTTVPATCGQSALQSNGLAYITQAVVDTRDTPSTARGVLRTALDPDTGALIGPSSYIATTAGLDGNQPTAAAIGPDGNLYVGFLKNGNIKRIVNPGSGVAQVVQSVGNTPQGHPARAFAFIGNDLFIASVDALSVILNATSPSCTGGCNATAISDGFTGAVHTGLTSDGVNTLYFAVAGDQQIPGSSQIWRYSTTNAHFTFVSQGGVDKNGANASNFSFVAGKTNLLALDAAGNLWIGDDTSNASAVGAGRLWTISAAALATLPAGSTTGGTNTQTIFNLLRGPWFMGFTQLGFTPTFNPDGTFTATILSNAGGLTTDSGTWTLTPPKVAQPIGNPQGHLTLTDSKGVVLFSADFLLLNADELVAVMPWTGSLGTPISGVLIKQTI